MEVELLRVIGKALNMSLHVVYLVEGKVTENFEDIPFIFVGMIPPIDYTFNNFHEYTRSYLTLRIAWYTPCAFKYQWWSRLFSIFSIDMWICFALSLVFAVITVSCI
jgi:hypothetical protein